MIIAKKIRILNTLGTIVMYPVLFLIASILIIMLIGNYGSLVLLVVGIIIYLCFRYKIVRALVA